MFVAAVREPPSVFCRSGLPWTESIITYVYDGGNVIAEYDGNNNLTRKYIHGARVDEMVCMIDVADSNAVYYYHYDGLGSVKNIVIAKERSDFGFSSIPTQNSTLKTQN
ncbi:MAG: hypothetical protein H8D56_08800 [Planctomycetes bacterium]|nr:hypothetical protein [Planctomycetota bacterium]MBL7146692.1 hypothetical protein [Phycisphaerae bacterium]